MNRIIIAICLIALYPHIKDGFKTILFDLTKMMAFALKHTIGRWRKRRKRTTRTSS